MNTKLLLLIPASSLLLLTSCQKEKSNSTDTGSEEIETTFTLSGNQAVSESIADDVIELFLEAALENNLGSSRISANSSRILGCGSVSIDPTPGFPKTFTIDFGSGCTGSNGVLRKGSIRVLLTDSVYNVGTTAILTFSNYSVYDYKVEGTIFWINKTTPNGVAWIRSFENGKVTNPTGSYYWRHVGSKEVKQTAGVNTPLNPGDDVYSATASHIVTNPQGDSREVTTINALEKKVSCSTISKGTLKVQGPNHYAVLNYGNGECDKTASISIDGRPARTFMLP